MQTVQSMLRIAVSVTCMLLLSCDTESVNVAPLEVPSGSTLALSCDDAPVSFHEFGGVPVVIVCRTEEDLETLLRLNGEVFAHESVSTDNSYRAVRAEIFVAITVNPSDRCKVEYVAANQVPRHWEIAEWPGGFYSPCHGEAYDLAGRQIKPGPFSPTQFPNYSGNLHVPTYRYISEHRIVFD